MSQPTRIDLTSLRDRLANESGPAYWRGLEELAETPEFIEWLHREFPTDGSRWEDAPSRRRFLQLMGASLALAGVGGCAVNEKETILPYVRAPESVVPGRPLYFATTLTLGGFGTGVLVESHMGRPTKIEGNEKHPASLGATDAFTQAAVLGLYDPDRSQVVLRDGQISTRDAALADLAAAMEALGPRRGAGLHILTETVGSPTLAAQLSAVLERFSEAAWHQYEPVNRDNARAGAILAFGRDMAVHYRLDKADRVVTLDADLLASGPGNVRYARDFADRRRLPSAAMNRLYAVESTPSPTGAIADHRLPLRPSLIGSLAKAMARRVGLAVGEGAEPAEVAAKASWLDAVAGDLKEHRGTSLVVAGETQPPAVHALAHAMNDALGNVGKTVVLTEPIEARPVDQVASLRELTRALEAGSVEVLVILGGNPAYDSPADLGFTAALAKAKRSFHLGLYPDETAARCRWHLPATHELESWGDARAFEGTASLLQPLIAPLYQGTSPHELLAVMLGQVDASSREIVREHWKSRLKGDDFDAAWETALHDGVIAGTEAAGVTVAIKPEAINASVPTHEGLEVIFRPDPTVWDGRFANNGWLQELPKPLTKLTWDNAALMAPATAERLGLANEEEITLNHEGRAVRAPVWIVPGHAAECVTVHLGYGRTRVGRVGAGTGFDAFAILTAGAPNFSGGLEVTKTGRSTRLACTQVHRSLEGRDLVRSASLSEFQAHPHFAQGHGHEGDPPSLYPEVEYEGHAWGMSINLNICNGCNACVVACQAENNVPIVGKDQVIRGREMHWLEIDRYYKGGNIDDPDEVALQPRLCMHCENAPCEVVCPVAATSHSAEGLNEMTYNRCVGTRYCANNCPYKVRHFNFLGYAADSPTSLEVLNNPDVSVRSRGVMEKCTYCVQRINLARIESKQTGRSLGGDEVVTACQGACPTRAIVFGDLNDRDSEVSKLKREPLDYGLLAELGTRPRTTYLARVLNPNPAIGSEASHATG